MIGNFVKKALSTSKIEINHITGDIIYLSWSAPSECLIDVRRVDCYARFELGLAKTDTT